MLHNLSEIQKGLRSGLLNFPQIVNGYLDQIAKTNHLNIYVEVFEEEVRQQAIKLQDKLATSPDQMGALFGMVMSIKDVICYKDHGVSAGSKILEDFQSVYTSTALQRAIDADVIIIGRTNCDEFAMGSTNENSHYGPTRNGVSPEHVPGGSSGGAAVSVQMDTCLAALGSDTGGSVRQPAAFCGVHGMKPTYGRISRYGLIAYGSSFDQIGIFAKDISNIQKTLSIIEGHDDMDSTSIVLPPEQKSIESSGKIKIAYFPEVINHEAISPVIKEHFVSFVDRLKQLGHEVLPVEFKYLDALVPTYYVLTTAEASSNLSRFDGIRYGHQATVKGDIDALYTQSRSEGFGPEVQRRIMMGSFVLSVGYFDAYFTKAQKVRRLISEQMDQIFSSYDYIVLPTTPSHPWKLGEALQDPIEMYLTDIYTVMANLCGLPAISVPAKVGEGQLPIGIQLMANKLNDANLLSFVKEIV